MYSPLCINSGPLLILVFSNLKNGEYLPDAAPYGIADCFSLQYSFKSTVEDGLLEPYAGFILLIHEAYYHSLNVNTHTSSLLSVGSP